MQKNQYELEYEYGITYVCVVQKDHFSGSKTISLQWFKNDLKEIRMEPRNN